MATKYEASKFFAKMHHVVSDETYAEQIFLAEHQLRSMMGALICKKRGGAGKSFS